MSGAWKSQMTRKEKQITKYISQEHPTWGTKPGIYHLARTLYKQGQRIMIYRGDYKTLKEAFVAKFCCNMLYNKKINNLKKQPEFKAMTQEQVREKLGLKPQRHYELVKQVKIRLI